MSPNSYAILVKYLRKKNMSCKGIQLQSPSFSFIQTICSKLQLDIYEKHLELY
jgi:hypothetical protein